MDLGSTIKKIRKERRLTQDEFASTCGITQTYLSQIENNQKEPNLSILKAISAKLDIPLPILFYLSLTKDDVPTQKQKEFEIVSPSVKALVHEFFGV